MVLWVRVLPLSLPTTPEPIAAALRYADGAGRPHVFLGDYDSYAWLRAARNRLRRGSPCDAVIDGECRDTYTLAPVGLPMPYPRSLHTAAIAATQRVAVWFDAQFPLALSAYLVPVLVGALGVLPAFAIGRRLAGVVGGFVAALSVSLEPLFLRRSLGSDNDVWNVVLPLCVAWSVIAALQARRWAPRLGGAALAGALSGLHAMTWRGWTFTAAVTIAGLIAAGAVVALRGALRQRTARIWRLDDPRAIAAVTIAYAISAAACSAALAGDFSLLRLPPALLGHATTGEPAAGAAGMAWPSALAVVSELAVPTLGGIAALSYGYVLIFIGWIGMLLLVLPRREWRPIHFAVIVAAALLYRILLTWHALGRAALIALLLLPLAAALAVDVVGSDGPEPIELGPGVLIATWLAAALALSAAALRFVLLLAAPLGIAIGVAAGRTAGRLDELVRARYGTAAAPLRAVVVTLGLAVAALPVAAGYRTAAAYRPAVDRSWADTFDRLRATSPPDAIIDAWWDYGYWAKYFAERRVAADGGTLLTPVPHWLARAQLAAAEDEAVGILRMLDCGSDAQPYPEGARGAYGKLVAFGIDPRTAYDTVVAVARSNRVGADRLLSTLGLAAAARADVLAATHCAPPPAYLVLATQQSRLGGFWQLGAWRPGADEAAGSARQPSQRLGLTTADWVDCEAVGDGMRRCRIDAPIAGAPAVESVEYREADPQTARARLAGEAAGAPGTSPEALLIARGDAIASFGDAAELGVGIALDADRHRILVGSPRGIASIYTRLMYLDGRGTTHFRRVDERTGPWGRVATWAIAW